MNFFDRAFKYCIRQRIKNLILFLIMTVIAVFLILSVSILKSSENATLNVKGEVNGKLHLTIEEEGNYGEGTGSVSGKGGRRCLNRRILNVWIRDILRLYV